MKLLLAVAAHFTGKPWKQETGNKGDNQNKTKPIQRRISLGSSWNNANEKAHMEEFFADQPGQ